MTESTLPAGNDDPNHTAGPSGEAVEQEDGAASEKLVPVGEAKKYRKRAQTAEKLLAELKTDLARKEQRLREHAGTIVGLQRGRAIDQALIAAEAIDLDAARMLVGRALDQDGDDADVSGVVADLRVAKPYLFRKRPPAVSALGVKSAGAPDDASIQDAASEAYATGRRQDLLRYLRLRRRKR